MSFMYLHGGDIDLAGLFSMFVVWIAIPLVIIGGIIYAVVDSKRSENNSDPKG